MRLQTMFLTQVTIIDCATLDSAGLPVGMSFNPKFTVTGPQDATESVVIDFSKAKKLIKQAIDSATSGFDHKFLVPSVFAEGLVVGEDGYTTFKNENVEVEAPTSEESIFRVYDSTEALVLNSNGLLTEKGKFYLETAISELVERYIERSGYKDVEVDVELTFNSDAPDSNGLRYYFKSAHGLRSSSSFGCQNILHGHFSYVQITDVEGKSCALDTARLIAQSLDGHYLVDAACVVHEGSRTGFTKVEYESASRGLMQITLSRKVPVLIMSEEVTIENIVDEVCKAFREELKDAVLHGGACYLSISEGLTKGATRNIQEL